MSLTSRFATRSRPIVRPLRPPSGPRSQPLPRFFANNRALPLVVSHGHPRAQLPYLDHTLHHWLRNNGAVRRQARYMATKAAITFWRYVITQAAKYAVMLYIATSLISYLIYQNSLEMLAWQFPVPDEWRWWTRQAYLKARQAETKNPQGTDWAEVGVHLSNVLASLEDTERDGKELKEVEEGGILIPGVGKAGFDLTDKSEAWRRICFDVLMTCAKANENMQGWVYVPKLKAVCRDSQLLGPSNPYPEPVPPGREVPLEEDAEPIPWSQPPENFYLKILTSKGFTTSQRVQAAIAYGNLLDDRSLSSSASEMFKWAMDIATEALDSPSAIIDPNTHIITDPKHATRNLIDATTALATHLAKTSDLSSSLAINLSILRARRSAPPSRSPPRAPQPSLLQSLLTYIRPIPFPPPPPNGDLPLQNTHADTIAEALLLSNIGEILFTSSPPHHESGLRWTRDSVALAESIFRQSHLPRPLQNRALETAEIALFNLRTMIQTIALEETTSILASADRSPIPFVPASWIPTWLGGESEEERLDRLDEQMSARAELWTRELGGMEKKLEELRSLLLVRLEKEGKSWMSYLVQGEQGGFSLLGSRRRPG